MEFRYYLRQILAGTVIYVVLAMIASVAQVPMTVHQTEVWRPADVRGPAAPGIVRLSEENIVP